MPSTNVATAELSVDFPVDFPVDPPLVDGGTTSAGGRSVSTRCMATEPPGGTSQRRCMPTFVPLPAGFTADRSPPQRKRWNASLVNRELLALPGP